MFVVYTEIFHENNNVERWFYGRYPSRNRANEVAMMLGREYPIFHCVVPEEEAIALGVKNMPNN